MPYTCLIQYVPDIVRDERINIGVIIVDFNPDVEMKAMGRLQNWSRVDSFAPGVSQNLIQFMDRIDTEQVKSMLDGSYHSGLSSIQMRFPCGTILSVEDALRDAISRYLVEPKA